MLVFFDESFRTSVTQPEKSLGILCGVAISEKQMYRVAADVFQLKLKHLGAQYAREKEIKGKELLKPYTFKVEAKGITSKNLALASDLLDYIVSKNLAIFGCVCFEDGLRAFRCEDVRALDKTFRYIFERVDVYLKREHPDRMAKLIFDDRDYQTNRQNAEAITNFFMRSPAGLALDSIIKIPLFAISEAHNIGLQLADVVTTTMGLRFAGSQEVKSYWDKLKPAIYRWPTESGKMGSGLKVLRGKP
jgi:hypothetical protein